MRHTYRAEQWLPYPVEAVFDFFANPDNLPRLMPAWQKASITDAVLAVPPPRPGHEDHHSESPAIAAGHGTRMTITFRPLPLMPIRLAWDAEITEFVWNDHFCDVQLRRGPFAYWRHCHSLAPNAREGVWGTLLHDRVEYELPFGPLGDVANALFVARQMRSIFQYRQKRTAEILAER